MAEKLEDLNLPNAVVSRLVKDALPNGVNIGKEARTALAKAASVFVLYITSAAINVSKKGQHKTLTGSDILEAMQDLEFEQFIEPLKESLEAFKKVQKEKKDATAKRKQIIAKDDADTAEKDVIELVSD